MKRALIVALALIAAPGVAQGQVADRTADQGGAGPEPTACDQADYQRALQAEQNARQQVASLRQEIARQQALLALASERNGELYAIAVEVIDRGLAPRSAEPFLQLKRVEMENLRQDFHDRAHQARIFPGSLETALEAQQQTSDQAE
ncbi:hypothetical protein [Pelagerythrobacter marensis]|uniref:Uncharacterized protein n=1 Tax=Pelagerythrobacter marensis TaxID=543877 RepID=A0A0G3X869_9SPHN|nr:hypothetical protein [Pelagerythrobacter marensis]AKM07750.1 hypothetical protein AM2010_1684 [Pelagerythrobacter marensis]